MTKEKFHIGQGVTVTQGPLARVDGRIQCIEGEAAFLITAGYFSLDDRPDKPLWRVSGSFWVASEDLEVLKTE